MRKQIISMRSVAQKGFTLIELMIVITIIGILATFAVPLYQDYTVRARVGEGLTLALSAKNLVVDNAMNGHKLDFGWDPSIFEPTTNTTGIAISSDTGTIAITSSAKAKNVVLEVTPYIGTRAVSADLKSGVVPSGRIAWNCKVASANYKLNWVPVECRN